MPRARRSKTSRVSFQRNFYSDLTMNNMLYAVTVRSPVNAGIITSTLNPNLPDDCFFVTARDVPGSNLIDTPLGKIPVFCEGNVSYLGEPVGLLVGPDERVLKNLVSGFQFEIDSMPIENYLEGLSDKDDIFSSNIAERVLKCGDFFDGNQESDFDRLFDGCDHVIEKAWTYALKTPDYGEPNGAVCYWKNDSVIIHTPTQWLNNLRHILSVALNLKNDAISIEKTASTNRGTNSIWYNSVIACQVAVASKKVGKPVKLVYTRDEQERFLDTMQSVTLVHKTGADKEGRLKAMQVEIDVDAGFSNPFAQEMIDRLVIASCGCYSPENLLVHAKAVRSHNPASSVDIQLIDSASFFAVENQMNLLAESCGITPVEIRLVNSNFDKSFQKKNGSAVPFRITVDKYSDAIASIVEKCDFNRKYVSFQMDSSKENARLGPKEYVSVFSSPMRGIGLACAFEGSGYYGSEVYGADHCLEVTMESPGSIVIHCPPISNAIHDVWAKLAAEILDFPFVHVKVNSEFAAGDEPPLPENVYANISVMTDLLKKCCLALKKKNPKEFPFSVKKKITPMQKKEWNSVEFCGKPFHSASFAVAIIEMEINPCTYREILKSVNIVVDGGKIMNIPAATSNIRLGVQKVFASLMEDDRIECDNVKISFMQSDAPPTQIGELVYQVIPAAYTQALSQALNCTIDFLPQKTDSLYVKMKEQKHILRILKEKSAQEKVLQQKNPSAEIQEDGHEYSLDAE